MDITDTLAPNSDQLDAVELTNPRIFQIEKVTKGNAEQPINVHLVDFPRPWRPGKSMRRVLGHPEVWGTDSTKWTGRYVELFCDPNVVFGGKAVGGTRIKRLSHIDGPKKVPLLVTRGKTEMYVVEPLPEQATQQQPKQAPEPTAEEVAACTDRDELTAMWHRSGAEMREVIVQRVADLDNEPERGESQ